MRLIRKKAANLNRTLLRLEGIGILTVSAALYRDSGGSLLWFVIFLLAPDLSMLGYLGGNRIGAVAYNLVHTYLLPLALVALGYGLRQEFLVRGSLIWIAHIGMDRALGYGLKYDTGFKDTHLQRV